MAVEDFKRPSADVPNLLRLLVLNYSTCRSNLHWGDFEGVLVLLEAGHSHVVPQTTFHLFCKPLKNKKETEELYIFMLLGSNRDDEGVNDYFPTQIFSRDT